MGAKVLAQLVFPEYGAVGFLITVQRGVSTKGIETVADDEGGGPRASPELVEILTDESLDTARG